MTLRSKNTAARVALALVVPALALAACGGGNSSSDDTQPPGTDQTQAGVTLPPVDTAEPNRGGTLTYGVSAETNGWDPSTSQWGPWGLTIAKTFFDTLTVFDEEGQIHPYLAESFTPNDDYSSWVIKLRPDVKFHNGEDLTAKVLKANWDFFSESPLVGRIFEQVESTEVIGDPETSLEMRANVMGSWVNFPEAWTTQIGVVLPMESLEADDAQRAQNPIGTGPFEFEEWIQDRFLRVVANDDYWREGLPYLDSIEFQVIPDPLARSQSLQTGDIDATQLEEPQQLEQFLDDPEFVTWQDPRTETAESLVMLNTMQPPLDDLRVRQALAYATDKELINETVTEGLRELANGPYRPSSPWYTEVDYPQPDPAAAMALVEEYEAENGPIEFTMEVGVGGADGPQVAQLLKEQWAQVGIDVEIGSAEVASLIANVVLGDYQAVVWRQFDSPTPLQETVWWHEDGAPDIGTIGLNFARNRDAELSEALDTSRTVSTDADEKAQFDIVQQRIAADVPYVWITHIEPAIVAETGVINVLHATIPGQDDLQAMSFHNSSPLLAQVWLEDPE